MLPRRAIPAVLMAAMVQKAKPVPVTTTFKRPVAFDPAGFFTTGTYVRSYGGKWFYVVDSTEDSLTVEVIDGEPREHAALRA